MRQWLARLFGLTTTRATAHPAAAAQAVPVRQVLAAPAAVQRGSRGMEHAPAGVTAPPAVAAAASEEVVAHPLQHADIAFLRALVDPPAPRALDDLPPDDRAFIAGVHRRLRTRDLDLPVVPEMALRLSRLFRDGAAVSEFVTLINRDASLAVEVLKTANSAFYGAGRPVTGLQDAIVRIGLDRLQAVLMVAHLRGKVLKGGPFQREADALMELALPVGHLASRVARGHDTAAETCFMRGALLHVEHLVILGATAAVSRDVKRAVTPSTEALHEAFVRFGREIREAVAQQWNLTELLLGDDQEPGLSSEYLLIRDAMICRWLRRPPPEGVTAIEGFPALVAAIPARVPEMPVEGPPDVFELPPIARAG